MKLILLRHAKSGWDDPLVADHDRPLNKRGRKSAPLVGQWLRDQGHLPDHVLCSTAARTRETLDRLDLPKTPTTYEDRLYLAPPDAMLALARQSDANTLLMIAHNPGIGELAEGLPDVPFTDPDIARFPTCACLVLDCPDGPDWHACKVLDFTTPRRLEQT